MKPHRNNENQVESGGRRPSCRFVHVGVAGLLAVATVTAIQVAQSVGATGSGTASVFVPIVPCRLIDTRPGADHVGPVAAALGAGETITVAVWGSNGNCTVPTGATGIATNVTAVNANDNSYLTVYPADALRPTASNLNVTPGSPPTPNQVTVGLSAAGAISTFNNAGSVDVVIDIVGYYEPAPAGSGPPGPPGPPGRDGTDGAACPAAGCVEEHSGYDAVQNIPNVSPYNYVVNGCLRLNPNGFAWLSFDLPAGARPTALSVRYHDGDAAATGKTVYSLYRSAGATPALDVSSSGTFVTTDGGLTDAVPVDANLPAESLTTNYYVFANPVGMNQYFCGAELTYLVG